MITGDKPNTAISIGRSTGIIDARTKDNHVIKLDLIEGNRDYTSILKCLKDAERRIESNPSIPFTLCVTGNMFSFITTNNEEKANGESLTSALVHLAMQVNSVILCRVFPKQKVRKSG